MNDVATQLQQKDIDYLAKEVASLKLDMNTGFTLLHAKLEMFNENYVKRKELDEILLSRDQTIEDLKSNQKWVVRIIISIVIAALMGLIIINK